MATKKAATKTKTAKRTKPDPEIEQEQEAAPEPATERVPVVGDRVIYTTVSNNEWRATIAERFGTFSNLTLVGAVNPDGGRVEMIAHDETGAPGTWRWE